MSTLPKVSLRLAAGIALALLACAGSAAADDADIRARIEQRLEKSRLQREGDIQVDVREGRAVLSGAVTNLPARRKAEKAALKETRTVDNRLRVLPSQPMSDALEQQLLGHLARTVMSFGVDNRVVLEGEEARADAPSDRR